MYRLSINSNLVVILIAFAAGLAGVWLLPGRYPDKMLEMPLAALFVGETGLALFCSLLFYENAGPRHILKLAAAMLGFIMLIGAAGNWSGQGTQMLPDSFLLINWVELAIMNIAGVLCMLTLYRLECQYELQALKALPPPDTTDSGAVPAGDTTGSTLDDVPSPAQESNTANGQDMQPQKQQSVQEILDKLDVSRIMRLERSIHPSEPASLDNLFQEENQAANSLSLSPASPVDLTPEESTSTAQGAGQVACDNTLLLPDAGADVATSDETIGKDLDEAFQNLVSRQALRDVCPETLAALSQSQSVTAAEAEGAPAGESTGDLADRQSPAGDTNASLLNELSGEAIAVQDFGRLSAKASAGQAAEQTNAGSMKTIGKMLIDTHAVENIIKQGERRGGLMTTSARIVSLQRGKEILSLLSTIDQYKGVAGSIIVGNDGLIISSTLKQGQDSDLVGAMSLAVHGNANMVAGRLHLGGARAVVLQSKDCVTVLHKLPDGILSVLCDSLQESGLDGLLDLISSMTGGKPGKKEQKSAMTAGAGSGADTKVDTSNEASSRTATKPNTSSTASNELAARSDTSNDTGSCADIDTDTSSNTTTDTSNEPGAAAAGAHASVTADLVRDLIASFSGCPDKGEPDTAALQKPGKTDQAAGASDPGSSRQTGTAGSAPGTTTEPAEATTWSDKTVLPDSQSG